MVFDSNNMYFLKSKDFHALSILFTWIVISVCILKRAGLSRSIILQKLHLQLFETLIYGAKMFKKKNKIVSVSKLSRGFTVPFNGNKLYKIILVFLLSVPFLWYLC